MIVDLTILMACKWLRLVLWDGRICVTLLRLQEGRREDLAACLWLSSELGCCCVMGYFPHPPSPGSAAVIQLLQYTQNKGIWECTLRRLWTVNIGYYIFPFWYFNNKAAEHLTITYNADRTLEFSGVGMSVLENGQINMLQISFNIYYNTFLCRYIEIY